jgi:hypothetical protein
VGEGEADGGATDAATDGAAEEGAADADPPLDVQAAMIGASAAAPPTSAIRSSRYRREMRCSTM